MVINSLCFTVMIKDYASALQWLGNLSSEAAFFKKKALPSLDEVNCALDLMGRPDKTFKYRVIVGGTAGKGSVCRIIEQTLVSKGIEVALLSSPHLQVVNERIRLNGVIISREDLTATISEIKNLIETENLELTYYEVIVLAGIKFAADQGVEILICEVGLGGGFDAVNAVQGPRLCGLTFIGDDHLEILGPKLKDVAETKSKIFTHDSVLNCTYEQKFSSILRKNSNIEIDYIKGIKQKLNKKLARKVLEQIIDSSSLIIPKTELPCRWERLDREIILDGAHSTPRFKYLEATKLIKNRGPYTLVLGMQTRHDLESFKTIIPYAKNIIWTESGETDCISAEALQKHYKMGEIIQDPFEAIKAAQQKEELILVTGSLYLCGRVRELFYKSEDILDQQTEWPQH